MGEKTLVERINTLIKSEDVWINTSDGYILMDNILSANIEKLFYTEKKLNQMDNTIKKILEELDASNIKNILWDEGKDKWVVSYKNNLTPDEFDYFFDALYWIRGDLVSGE